jgi:hypothetical protein
MRRSLRRFPLLKIPYVWRGDSIRALPKHSCDLQIIAIWNIVDKICLNVQNKDWLKELAK